MVSLTKLVKTIIYTALLNKAVKGPLISVLMRSLGRIMRPSTILAVSAFIAALLNRSKSSNQPSDKSKNVQTILESTLASMLLKATKGSGFTVTEAEVTSAIRTILSTFMRDGFSSVGRQDNKNRIIESNDYKVVYDK